MKRTVAVMGTGAQGGTIAMRLNDEPNVEKIICADYDLAVATRYEKMLDKAVAVSTTAYGQIGLYPSGGHRKPHLAIWQPNRSHS